MVRIAAMSSSVRAIDRYARLRLPTPCSELTFPPMGGNQIHHCGVQVGFLFGAAAQHVQVQVALADMTEQHRDRVGCLPRRPARWNPRRTTGSPTAAGRHRIQRRPEQPDHLGGGLPDLPEPLLRGAVHSRRPLAGQVGVLQRIGQALGQVGLTASSISSSQAPSVAPVRRGARRPARLPARR